LHKLRDTVKEKVKAILVWCCYSTTPQRTAPVLHMSMQTANASIITHHIYQILHTTITICFVMSRNIQLKDSFVMVLNCRWFY